MLETYPQKQKARDYVTGLRSCSCCGCFTCDRHGGPRAQGLWFPYNNTRTHDHTFSARWGELYRGNGQSSKLQCPGAISRSWPSASGGLQAQPAAYNTFEFGQAAADSDGRGHTIG